MKREEHIKRHKELHRALDELIADYITHVPTASIDDSIYTLMKWSHEQTGNPTEENIFN